MATSTLDPVAVEPGAQRMGLAHFAVSLGSEEAVDELTQRRGRRLSGARRAAADGRRLPSVVLDPDMAGRVEVTA